jgi:hypothetical protein
MTPYMPYARPARRRADGSLFFPILLALTCIAILAVTLPLSGVHIPGQRHLQAILDQIPQPWKPPRPVYVAPPDPEHVAPAPVTAAEPPASNAGDALQTSTSGSATQAGAAAPPQAQPAATQAPAQPVSASPAPLAAAQTGGVQAAADLPAPPPSFRLSGFRHQWQTWTNCGPATITMALSHFGRSETQAQAAPFLKPNANDKNVSPDELVAYVRSLGMMADWRVAGDLDRIKQLVANDVPVVVETWFTPHPNDGMGHYRLIVGYDDAAQRLTAYDSYEPPGQNVPIAYRTFDVDWKVFNRTYIPVYSPAKAGLVAQILGADRDDAAMYERALAVARGEAATLPNDPYGWFNAGTNLVALGRPAEAVAAFDRARALKLPWRMLWYQFAPFEAYLAAGRLNDVTALANANLQQASDLEESVYYRGRALQAQGQPAAARTAYQAAAQLNPRYQPAYYALSTLG